MAHTSNNTPFQRALQLGRSLCAAAVLTALCGGASLAMAQQAASAPQPVTSSSPATAGQYDLLVGTYTVGTDSKGIYVYRFDTANGQMTLLSTTAAENPSYLAVTRDLQHVYAVDEIPGDTKPGSPGGKIAAFSFDAASGKLTFIDSVPSMGNDPTYLTMSPDEHFLVTANYSVAADPGGSLTMFPVTASGAVAPAVTSAHHEGAGPVTGRQDNSHVHSTVFSPDGRYLFAQDLGVDKVFAYRYNADAQAPEYQHLLMSAPKAYTALPAGSGPRHLIFDASGKHAYLTTEMNASVTVFAYDDGRLTQTQAVTMTEPGFKGGVGGGAIHLSADGHFLYTTNRGDVNQIVTYAVDPTSGHLALIDRRATLGKTPREFAIDPSGNWFFVGNQDSNNVVIFHRDPETGKLGAVASQMQIGAPVYFKFVAAQ